MLLLITKVFHQPSGLIEDEKGQFIKKMRKEIIFKILLLIMLRIWPVTIIQGLQVNKPEGFIKKYIAVVNTGLVESGKRVYPEFNYDKNSIDKLEPIQGDSLRI